MIMREELVSGPAYLDLGLASQDAVRVFDCTAAIHGIGPLFRAMT